MITWITGNSGAGKTVLAKKLNNNHIILDGDEMRKVWRLGFSKKDRWEQNLRIARLAKILEKQKFNIIIATICPYVKLRQEVKKITNCKFIYLSGGKKSSKKYPYEKDSIICKK